MTDAIFDTVVRALRQAVPLDSRAISPATTLQELRLGRFSRLKLAIFLEEACDIEVQDEEIVLLETVGDIVRYVDRWSLGAAA